MAIIELVDRDIQARKVDIKKKEPEVSKETSKEPSTSKSKEKPKKTKSK